jgi:hypothetical protein
MKSIFDLDSPEREDLIAKGFLYWKDIHAKYHRLEKNKFYQKYLIN